MIQVMPKNSLLIVAKMFQSHYCNNPYWFWCQPFADCFKRWPIANGIRIYWSHHKSEIFWSSYRMTSYRMSLLFVWIQNQFLNLYHVDIRKNFLWLCLQQSPIKFLEMNETVVIVKKLFTNSVFRISQMTSNPIFKKNWPIFSRKLRENEETLAEEGRDTIPDNLKR